MPPAPGSAKRHGAWRLETPETRADPSRPLGFINPAIYQIARSPHYHHAFHDITTGNNTAQLPPTTITGYQAAPGWDPVTGWGRPNAQVLIPLLARYASP